jgi:hypothetical protein
MKKVPSQPLSSLYTVAVCACPVIAKKKPKNWNRVFVPESFSNIEEMKKNQFFKKDIKKGN